MSRPVNEHDIDIDPIFNEITVDLGGRVREFVSAEIHERVVQQRNAAVRLAYVGKHPQSEGGKQFVIKAIAAFVGVTPAEVAEILESKDGDAH